MSVLIKVVDAILAGKQVKIATDRETLTQVFNACCEQLKALHPANRVYKGKHTEFHPWDDLVSNYLQFVMDTCPTNVTVVAGASLAIKHYNFNIHPKNIKAMNTLHDRYGAYLRQTMESETPKYKEPYEKYQEENTAERESVKLRNEARKAVINSWSMFSITTD